MILAFVSRNVADRQGRHWGVFFAGTIMLMVFWIITPLQSAIFNTGSVVRSRSTMMGTSTNLIPIQSQTNTLNANFLNTAYGISWLGQKLPSYATAEYSVLPFRPLTDASSALPTETWSTTANAYSTNLTCSPANTTLDGLTYTFDNGNGCLVPEIALPDAHHISQISNADSATQSSDFMLLYIGYYDNPQVDYSLQNPNCTIQHSNNFLALFAPSSSRTAIGVYSNLTALFCSTTYHVGNISVIVNASNHAIVDGSAIYANASVNLPENTFNTTAFEYILGAGVSPTGDRSNLPDSSVLEQYPRLKNYSLTWPVSNMVGFAVALNPLQMQDLATPAVLQTAFQNAHQLLFTTAFDALLGPPSVESLSDVRPGVRWDNPGAIIMVRTISLIVEAAFGMVAILTLCLWYISHHRGSNLDSDPASIASIMSLAHANDETPVSIDNNGTLTSEELEHELSRQRYHLREGSDCYPILVALPSSSSSAPSSSREARRSKDSLKKSFLPVLPLELRLWFGGSLIAVLITSLATLVFLQMWSSKHLGK